MQHTMSQAPSLTTMDAESWKHAETMKQQCASLLDSNKRVYGRYQDEMKAYRDLIQARSLQLDHKQQQQEATVTRLEQQKQQFRDSQWVEWNRRPYDCLRNTSKLSCTGMASAQHEKCKCQKLFGGRAHLYATCNPKASLLADPLTYDRCIRKGYLDNHRLEIDLCPHYFMDKSLPEYKIPCKNAAACLLLQQKNRAPPPRGASKAAAPTNSSSSSSSNQPNMRNSSGSREPEPARDGVSSNSGNTNNTQPLLLLPELPPEPILILPTNTCLPCSNEFDRLQRDFSYDNLGRTKECIDHLGLMAPQQQQQQQQPAPLAPQPLPFAAVPPAIALPHTPPPSPSFPMEPQSTPALLPPSTPTTTTTSPSLPNAATTGTIAMTPPPGKNTIAPIQQPQARFSVLPLPPSSQWPSSSSPPQRIQQPQQQQPQRMAPVLRPWHPPGTMAGQPSYPPPPPFVPDGRRRSMLRFPQQPPQPPQPQSVPFAPWLRPPPSPTMTARMLDNRRLQLQQQLQQQQQQQPSNYPPPLAPRPVNVNSGSIVAPPVPAAVATSEPTTTTTSNAGVSSSVMDTPRGAPQPPATKTSPNASPVVADLAVPAVVPVAPEQAVANNTGTGLTAAAAVPPPPVADNTSAAAPSAVAVPAVATAAAVVGTDTNGNNKDNWMKVLYIVLIVALIGLGVYLVYLVFKCLPVNAASSRLAIMQNQLNRDRQASTSTYYDDQGSTGSISCSNDGNSSQDSNSSSHNAG